MARRTPRPKRNVRVRHDRVDAQVRELVGWSRLVPRGLRFDAVFDTRRLAEPAAVRQSNAISCVVGRKAGLELDCGLCPVTARDEFPLRATISA